MISLYPPFLPKPSASSASTPRARAGLAHRSRCFCGFSRCALVTRSYLTSGRISILRKRISAPSDWKISLPRVRLDRVPMLTTWPLTMFVMVSPSQITSIRFHCPAGFSTSRRPRKPRTSFHSGSRSHQLNRPESRVSAFAPFSK